MNGKTKAIAEWTKMTGLHGTGYVYQFSAGHWGCCTTDSPVGRDLATTGYIYHQLGIKAQTFEPIAW